MNKLYNTYEEISNNLYSYFSKFTLSKTFLNFFPQLLISIIKAESSTFSKIALAASKIFPSILLDSITKRIHRFFNNSNYNLKNLYSNVIYDVLSRLTLSHGGTDNLHVSFDHTYIKDKYTILMFTLRIGKQGIPLYFEIFPGKDDERHGDAFKTKTIKDGITFCHNLLSEFFPNAKIIFLADRWFGNLFPLMNYINELGDIYVFRLKENCKVFFYDKNEGHKIWVSLNDIPHYVHKSNIIENLEFTKKKYVANLVFCKSKGHKEPWKLITNGNPKQAKAFYGYRFGSIESVFKLTKTKAPTVPIIKILAATLIMGAFGYFIPKTTLFLFPGILLCMIVYFFALILVKFFTKDDIATLREYSSKLGPLSKIVNKMLNFVEKIEFRNK